MTTRWSGGSSGRSTHSLLELRSDSPDSVNPGQFPVVVLARLSRAVKCCDPVRSLVVVFAMSVTLAACGDGGRGQPRAPAASEMIGGGCSSSESGSSNGPTRTTPTTCAVVFENGEQFSCPKGVRARTPAGVAATSGCRQIAPVRFPAAWKVVMHQIAAVRDCLRHRGDRVIENVVTSGLPGGSPTGTQSGNPRLVGELVVGVPAPAFIGFTLHPPFSGAHKPLAGRSDVMGTLR